MAAANENDNLFNIAYSFFEENQQRVAEKSYLETLLKQCTGASNKISQDTAKLEFTRNITNQFPSLLQQNKQSYNKFNNVCAYKQKDSTSSKGNSLLNNSLMFDFKNLILTNAEDFDKKPGVMEMKVFSKEEKTSSPSRAPLLSCSTTAPASASHVKGSDLTTNTTGLTNATYNKRSIPSDSPCNPTILLPLSQPTTPATFTPSPPPSFKAVPASITIFPNVATTTLNTPHQSVINNNNYNEITAADDNINNANNNNSFKYYENNNKVDSNITFFSNKNYNSSSSSNTNNNINNSNNTNSNVNNSNNANISSNINNSNSLILNVSNNMKSSPIKNNLLEEEIRETFLKQIKPMLVKLVTLEYPDDVYKQNRALKRMEDKQLRQLLNNLSNNSNSSFSNDNYSTFNPLQPEQHDVSLPFDFNDLPDLEEAKLWTRSCLNEFKQVLVTEPDSVLEIGSGEIVTVRVPTHHLGTTMFWEFASDLYDIGFALYFEWQVLNDEDDDDDDVGGSSSSHSQQHRRRLQGDEEEEEGEEESYNEADDNYIDLGDHSVTSMSGSSSRRRKKGGVFDAKDSDCEEEEDDDAEEVNNPVEEVVSLARVNSHEEVQCGCHGYDKLRGVYLFKFDNSFSLLRGKKVYYRVVCT